MDSINKNNQSYSEENNTSYNHNPAPHSGSKMGWIIGGLLVLVVIILLALYFSGFFGLQNNHGAAAVVNGEKITQNEFNQRMDRIRQLYQQQGQTLEDGSPQETQIKTQILNDMINRTLLLGYIEDQGVTATEEEVDEAYNQALTQFESEDALKEQLSQQGLTMKDLRKDIREQVKIRKFSQQYQNEQNITATNEEVTALYQQASAQSQATSTPALEEVRGSLEDQVIQQKIAQGISQLIQERRAQATITVNIEGITAADLESPQQPTGTPSASQTPQAQTQAETGANTQQEATSSQTSTTTR